MLSEEQVRKGHRDLAFRLEEGATHRRVIGLNHLGSFHVIEKAVARCWKLLSRGVKGSILFRMRTLVARANKTRKPPSPSPPPKQPNRPV